MSYLSVGVSPGNVPIHHYQSNKMREIDRKIRISEMVLRCLVTCLSVVAALVIATDSQVRQILYVTKKAKYTDLKALIFLVVASGMVAAYSVVQLLRCVVSEAKGTVLLNKPLAWAIFSSDQLMAYLILSALAAQLQASMFSKFGQPELQWLKVCDLYGKFCNQVAVGIAAALFATIGMVIVSAISAFSLFRLYGGNKGKYSARW